MVRTLTTFVLTAALLWLAISQVHADEPNQLTSEQIADGWINLFDGETLFGWQPTSNANWKVEDGAITVSEGQGGFLATNAEFADYELHVEFKAPPTTNSGVFLRTPLDPKDPAKDCIEVNIAPRDNPFPTPSLVGRLKAVVRQGSLVRQEDSQGYRQVLGNDVPDPWDGKWHALDVMLHGYACEVGLDRAIPYDYFDEESNYGSLDKDDPRRGRISLQFREGPVAFRNIRLRPLGMKPMLNGKDLAGWNADKAEASKFEVTRAERGRESFATGGLALESESPVAKDSRPLSVLHVTGGRGQLDTNDSYGDFVMQLDCRVDGDGLNSGVFYRCIPREFMNGYECQIHNAIKDNDPTKPADFGTGGIYRRIPARRVVSKDREWFTMTLIPTGAHTAVWVNGYQVTDWTDDRPEHENPRNGLRLKPGTIALQGHDPTTNLRFRNLRIAELPEKTNHDGTTNTTEEEKK